MNATTLFDAEDYFRAMTTANVCATEHGFVFTTCSGPQSLEGALNEFRDSSAIVCFDDTNDGAMFRGRGGGWYKKRTFTVFIIHRYDFMDMADRKGKMALCRQLFHQMASKMLVDAEDLSNELVYLDTSNIMAHELGRYTLNGCTGLYFMIDVSEPVDLKFRPEQWN